MGPVVAAVVAVGLIYVGIVAAASFGQQQQGIAAMQQQQQQAVCLGLGRRPVDWWQMLKHPAGYQYSYLDSSMLGNSSSSSTGACPGGSCWRHRLSMLNPNPVAHTLAALAAAAAASKQDPGSRAAAGAAELAYVIYNDADPAGTEHFDFAHAKGVAAFSSSNSGSFLGFWLVHSAPRFPQAPSVTGFDQLNRSQAVFGQHFSCVSLAGAASVNAVAQLLLVAGPYVYSSSLPAAAAAVFPAWQQLLAGGSDQQQHSIEAVLHTPGQQQLLGFAKTKFLVEQLTDAVVGPGLGSSMLWETWRRSHDALPSQCGQDPGQLSSLNVQQVAFPGTPYRWPWSLDHSKWGVSVQASSSSNGSSGSNGDGGEGVVCLGDMNRAAWQAHRGGGYVCMQHQGLWQAFSSIVAAVEECVTEG